MTSSFKNNVQVRPPEWCSDLSHEATGFLFCLDFFFFYFVTAKSKFLVSTDWNPAAVLPVSPSAALARLDDHVGQLLHFGGSSGVVEDGEGLQVLGDAAGGGGRFRVEGVVQAQ